MIINNENYCIFAAGLECKNLTRRIFLKKNLFLWIYFTIFVIYNNLLWIKLQTTEYQQYRLKYNK